ncbi:MAG: hypothetical protein E7642_05560 [Ruminococcaceae bacterium]|nr:hypothetical protein [Oscillospiraceae bacterium]
MIRGIERRVVEMKLTGNRFYERACLVLKVDPALKVPDENELIEEARRIISQVGEAPKNRGRRAFLLFALGVFCFFLGALIGVLATFALK